MAPLEGVRIIAVEVYGAGPYGSTFLADLGAEVIKIEHRQSGGDVSRVVGPHFLGGQDSHFFQTFNRNKKSLALDLKHPLGQQVLHKLAATADGLMGNLRGDQPEKLGITHERLKSANQKLVCAHLSAYGRDSERKSWPGYDYLMQSEAGHLAFTGEPDGPPARMGLSVVDYAGGLVCALGLLAAILEARRSGRGRDLDVSLFDCAMHYLSYPAAWYLNEGTKTERLPRSAHPSIAPSQLFRTRDGWIFIMAQTQRFWELLCEKLGRAELVTSPEFVDMASRRRNLARLTQVLDTEFGRKTTREWVSLLGGTVPCGPVNDLAQALDNPFFRERGGVQSFDHPGRRGFKLVANPIRIGEPLPARPAPALGEHTDQILKALGFSEPEIQRMRQEGAI